MGYPKDCSWSENWEVITPKIIITSYYKVLFNYICGPQIQAWVRGGYDTRYPTLLHDSIIVRVLLIHWSKYSQ